MKAVRIVDGEPTLEDAPLPSGDDVRVKVEAVGICGSDLHLLSHGFAEGRVLGHEIAGRLDDGTPVGIEPFFSCGGCAFCIEGTRHRCAEAQIIGIMVDGGMAEYVGVPPEALVRLPAGVDVKDASLAENLGIAVHAMNRAGLRTGDRVAVVGAGAIGLASVAALRQAGHPVDIAARHDHQAAAAERLGATVGLADNYDVVFDAVGSTESLADSIRRCRPEGRVVVEGSFWDPVQLDMTILMQEVELIPASMYGRTPNGREMDGAASLLAELPELGDTLITHRFPLDGAADAFAAATDRSAGAIKVVFEPHG